MTANEFSREDREECLADWGEQYRLTMIDVGEYRRRLKQLGLSATEADEEVRRNAP